MINAHCYALMIKLLMDREISRSQIMEETGLHQVTVSRYVAQLHRVGVIYISSWQRDVRGKCWVPFYAMNLDGMKDAKRPKKMTVAERSARYRQKQAQIKMLHAMSGQANHP